jgi:Ca2+-binding EF-hand superfamily protein
MFKILDFNGDGLISQEELLAFTQKMNEFTKVENEEEKENPYEAEEYVKAFFAVVDVNKDNEISIQEYVDYYMNQNKAQTD